MLLSSCLWSYACFKDHINANLFYRTWSIISFFVIKEKMEGVTIEIIEFFLLTESVIPIHTYGKCYSIPNPHTESVIPNPPYGK